MNPEKLNRQTPMTYLGWILVTAGLIALVASLALVLFARSEPNLPHSATDLYIRDTYYVIAHPHSIWPLILCAALSLAVTVIGYMHTHRFIENMIPIEDLPPSLEP